MKLGDACLKGHLLTESMIKYRNINGYKAGYCKLCDSERQKQFRINNPARVSDYKLKTLYGLTHKERNELLISQNNSCIICGTSDCSWGTGFHKRWHIDHIHDGTKNHRGILCSDCNLALGKLEPNLNKVIEYLNKYK